MSNLTLETSGATDVRRQWIDLTADVLADVRRKCWKLLPYAEAEDLAAEVLKRELEAGAEAGRKNCVRSERLTAAYLKLTALDWRTGREAARLAELAKSDDDDGAAELAAEDVISPGDDSEDWRTVDAYHLYRQAAELARRLWIVPTRPVVLALAQGMSDATAAELASEWAIPAGTFKREAASGADEIRKTYPNVAELAELVAPDFSLAVRTTPLAGVITGADGHELRRKIGEDLPESGASRHRTAGQLAREAEILLARAPLAGRKATASKATSGDWRTTGGAGEVTERTAPVASLKVVELLRRTNRMLASLTDHTTPRSGPRPHSQYRCHHTPKLSVAPAPTVAETGYGLTYTGAACELGWRSDVASRTVCTAHATRPVPTADYASRTRPALATWSPGAHTAPHTAPRRHTVAAPAERINQAPELVKLRRRTAAPNRARRVLRWLELAPGALIDASLDMVTAAELEREAAEAFPMVEDMIAASAD